MPSKSPMSNSTARQHWRSLASSPFPSKSTSKFRERSAAMQPVEDRASAAGDTVTVNLVGKFLDNPDQEDLKADDVEVELGGRGVQQEFTENLTGVKADDEKIFTVSYPEDFKSEGLAGKRLEY